MLFCEGKRTEPSYFEGIRRQLRRAAVDIRVRPQVGSPSRLVRHAVRADLDGVDEVWCLFDVEAPEPHGDLNEALRLAAGNPAIRLAVSNPCFELWLLLHFEDQAGYLTSADARTKLTAWLPNIGKHLDARDRAVALMFEQVDAAINHAVRLEPDAAASTITKRNPSTSVRELLLSLHSPSDARQGTRH